MRPQPETSALVSKCLMDTSAPVPKCLAASVLSQECLSAILSTPRCKYSVTVPKFNKIYLKYIYQKQTRKESITSVGPIMFPSRRYIIYTAQDSKVYSRTIVWAVVYHKSFLWKYCVIICSDNTVQTGRSIIFVKPTKRRHSQKTDNGFTIWSKHRQCEESSKTANKNRHPPSNAPPAHLEESSYRSDQTFKITLKV